MGREATLKAVGPFSDSIVHLMDYPPEYYSDVPRGAKVVLTAVVCASSASSDDLATALGFGCWELHKHCFSAEDLLEQIKDPNFKRHWTCVSDGWGRFIRHEDLKTLCELEFDFIFEPNG